MKHYWIKYSYNTCFGKNSLGREYICNQTQEEFVEFANVEELKSYCAELRLDFADLKIESIVKL